MKKIAYFAGGIAVAVSMATIAGSFTAPNTFTSGTTISSADMNANFAAVKTAVDDNDARITSLESGTCPADMVSVGPVCVDRYEATVENVATTAYVGDLAAAALCDANGNDCKGKIVARSVQGQTPTINVTWFQAQQACAAAGKRLLTNAEWQMAAAGTPDGAPNGVRDTSLPCTTRGITGDDPACISNWGVNDMVGNVNEWVADWVQADPANYGTANAGNTNWGGDAMAGVSAVSTTGDSRNFPAAIYRGGRAGSSGQGVFAFYANLTPAESSPNLGFRCAK